MSSPLTSIDDLNVDFRSSKSPSLKALFNHVLAAIRDGLSSMHHYEDLRAHGVSHVAAAEKACTFKS